MNNLAQAIRVELLKVRRSRMPWLTLLAFSLAPLAGGFFMFVLKDPVLARELGLISAKAQILAGSADWPAFLGLLAQAVAVGGFGLFSVIGSWVFGREFADHTLQDLLALPTRRSTIVLAKFVVILLWTMALTLVIYCIGLGVGAALDLPLASAQTFARGTKTLAVVTVLTVALVPPIVLAASVGRGYLSGVGVAMLVLVLAQLVAAAGWGEYFPWAVPALHAGVAGAAARPSNPVGYLLVGVMCLACIILTLAWWERADHAG